MRLVKLVPPLVLAAVIAMLPVTSHAQTPVQTHAPTARHGALHRAADSSAPAVRFIENRGQVVDDRGATRPDVRFTCASRGVALYLATDRISYVYSRTGADADAHALGEAHARHGDDSTTIATWRMDMRFVGANPGATIEPLDALPGVVNIYRGDRSAWVTGARIFGSVVYRNLYPRIDMVVHASAAGVKCEYVVHPGGRVSDIVMRYDGAATLGLDGAGRLRAENPLGFLEDGAPWTYQPPALAIGSPRTVRSRYVVQGGLVHFATDCYDSTRDLVIDPMQAWGTFYGGGGGPIFDMEYLTGGDAAALDHSGNALVAGTTLSSSFPATPGALRFTLQGIVDAFVAKFDPYGNVVFATFFGGTNGDDNGHGVAADGLGNVFLCGHTSSTNLPLAAAFQATFAGGVLDGFVAKFTGTGALVWSTYCGTAFWDDAYGIAVDSAGNASVLLTTTGATLTGGAVTYRAARSGAHPTGGGPVNNDLLVVKYNGASGQPSWAKFLGGAGLEYGYAAAVDPRNNILVTGWTGSTDFPVTPGCAQPASGGGYDALVAKLDSAGATLWSTYLGGAGTENNGFYPIALVGDVGVGSVAADADGNVFVTGATSGGFPTSPGAWNVASLGGQDAFLVKLDSNGLRQWSTYIGTAGTDCGLGVAATATGAVVVGATTANGLPTVRAGQEAPLQAAFSGGGNDAFIVKVDRTGAPTWVTYYGGSGDEAGNGVACDAFGSMLIAGATSSAGPAPFALRSTHQVAAGQPIAQAGNNGGYDAFLSLFCDSDPPRVDSSGGHHLCDGDQLRTWLASGYRNVKWFRKDPPTYATATELVAFRGRDTLAIADSGRYYATAESPGGCPSTTSDIVITRSGRINPVVAPAAPVRICTGDTITLSVGPGTFAGYKWERSPGIYETTPTMRVWSGGTYRVTVTNARGCRDSASIAVQAFARPAPVAAAHDTTICAGDQALLTATGGAGGTLQWYSTSGPAILATGTPFRVDSAGTYYALSTSPDGCTARSNNVVVTVHRKPKPVIIALTSAVFCDGDSAQLEVISGDPTHDALRANAYAAYAWSDGGTGRRIIVRDIPIGTTMMTVTVTDTNGCTASVQIPVTRNARPKPGIVASPDTVVCEGDSVTLSADRSYAGYAWNTGATDQRITVARVGSTPYVLTATTPEGCQAVSDTVHVTVHPRPKATISGPGSVCVNSAASFSVPAQAGVSYAWEMRGPSGTIASGAGSNAIDVNWGGAGANAVIVAVTDPATGCVGRDTLAVTVGSVLKPNVTPSGAISLCAGDTVVLDAGPNFTSYAWSSGERTRSIRVVASGSYTVTVANASGCSGTSDAVVVTITQPRQPVITALPALSVCAGDTVVLDAGGGFAAYQWSNGASVRMLRVARADSFEVTTTDSNGCRATSARVHVAINPLPVPSITGPNSACINSTVGYGAAIAGAAAGDRYQWKMIGAHGAITGGQGTSALTVQWNTPDDDTLEVTVQSAATGCTGSARYAVSIGTSLKPVLTTASGRLSFCDGDSIVLEAPASYASYRWSPTNETTRTITVRSGGTYTVAVTDATGCSGSGAITVTATPPFTPTVSATAPGFCAGDSVRLDAPAGFAAYRWSPTGATTASIWVTAKGNYSVTAADADGCTGTSAPVAVREYAAPVIVRIDQSGADLIAVVDETTGPPVAGYQWYADGAPIAGATLARLSATANANYEVEAVGADGCRSRFGPVRPASAATSELALPDLAAAPGDRVSVPLMLTASGNLDRNHVNTFRARLRFNKTLLLPVGAAPGASTIAGDDRVMTITGTRGANTVAGELVRLEFVAALGNAERTPLTLETFEWLDTAFGTTAVTVTNGTFALAGLCEQGGRRLLASTVATKIAVIRPNPTNGTTAIAYDLAERGATELYVADMLGNRIATLVDGVVMPGRYEVEWNAGGIASGTYTVVLATPTERLTQAVRVVR